MRPIWRRFTALMVLSLLEVQGQVKPSLTLREITEKVQVIRLAPRFATAIRVPETISSVIIGDPSKFLAEHSDKEPSLVVVKPITEDPCESNLLLITSRGHQISFFLKNVGAASGSVDFAVRFRTAGSFLVQETGHGTLEVAGTEPLRKVQIEEAPKSANQIGPANPLDALLDRQMRTVLPPLYGQRSPTPEEKQDYVKAGVSEVIDQGRQVLVLFSVVNPQSQAIELLAPQIQLAGRIQSGTLFKRRRWGSSEQLAVKEFRLSRRRLGAGERADGVAVFDRPNFKQSNEAVFLQIAESGAVDRPALAPIGFGVSSIRKEVRGDE
jgi:hypothetical protein